MKWMRNQINQPNNELVTLIFEELRKWLLVMEKFIR